LTFDSKRQAWELLSFSLSSDIDPTHLYKSTLSHL